MISRIFIVLGFFVPLCFAQLSMASEEKISTEIGLYGFASSITGDATIRNVESDLDISPKDILENLDVGAMGFIEHRRNKWSFIGDMAYMKLSTESTIAKTAVASVSIDAELQQAIAEGFVGYRFHEADLGSASVGFDILGGARFTYFNVSVSAQAAVLGLATSRSRERDEDWVDGVVGLRAQYKNDNGWGASGWVDLGLGDDSHSVQAIGVVSHTFDNNIRLFGGYRYLNLNYETGSGSSNFELDAHFHGPMIGLAYKF